MLLLQVFIVTTLLISSENAVTVRSCRRLPRNNGWFDHVWNTYSDTRFKKTFRVSKATFDFILGRIEHDLQRDTVAEEPIPPAFRLAVCLYRLARGDYFYTIAEMTGLGNSTVCGIVSEVTKKLSTISGVTKSSDTFQGTKRNFGRKFWIWRNFGSSHAVGLP